MTAEGLQKLKEELQQLETIERPRVIAAIAEAREKGDLSENAEYDAAKEEQGVLESKIAMIKAKIMDARIIKKRLSGFLGLYVGSSLDNLTLVHVL